MNENNLNLAAQNIYIYATTRKLGYIAAQVAQGALECGAQVFSNLVQPYTVDGRQCPPSSITSGIQYLKKPNDSDILLIDETESVVAGGQDLSNFYSGLLSLQNKYKIAIIYYQDDANAAKFPDELALFITHKSNNLDLNKRSFPIAFGFTSEGFRSARAFPVLNKRAEKIVINFQPSENQFIRSLVLFHLYKNPSLVPWLDTRHLFGEAYSHQLTNSSFMLSVGGTMMQSLIGHSWLEENFPEHPLIRNFRSYPPSEIAVSRWDSFRFWEAMAFGCIPIQLDFDFYELKTQVTPVGWKHYIPLRLHDLDRTWERILRMTPDQISEISTQAKDWSFENYHPVRTYDYVVRSIEDFYLSSLTSIQGK